MGSAPSFKNLNFMFLIWTQKNLTGILWSLNKPNQRTTILTIPLKYWDWELYLMFFFVAQEMKVKSTLKAPPVVIFLMVS